MKSDPEISELWEMGIYVSTHTNNCFDSFNRDLGKKKKKKTRARKSLSDHLFHSRHFTDEETEVSPEAATCPSPGYHLVAKQESQLALNLS